MNRHRLTATLLSPLVVRKERQSQRSEGVSSLPGTLVRGALARLYLEQRGEADKVFQQLFVDEQTCRYGPLDPGERVFPRSAASCKREGGFATEGKHGMIDLLWSRIARRLLGKELPEPWRKNSMGCCYPKCDNDLKAKEGFWTIADGVRREAANRWLRGSDTHVGIDRFTHSAQESILYSLPTLQPRDEAIALVGWLDADPAEVQQLRQLLAEEAGEIRIGHARTRGYGLVRLEIGEVIQPTPSDRTAWSEALIGLLGRVGLPFDPARHFFFSLGLPTGALLFDQVLRYSLDPAGMVSWLPPLPPPDATKPVLDFPATPFEGGKLWCLTAIASHERLRGWNAAHGLPRQDEWIVSRGAVYAYLFEGDESSRASLLSRLNELETSGLGGRRNEGFGDVVVSDEFHSDYHTQEQSA
jgi:CRISPR-associated Csx10 family RAMP protein